MNSARKSSVALTAAVIVMAIACFLPAMHYSDSSPMPGWAAAYYSQLMLRYSLAKSAPTPDAIQLRVKLCLAIAANLLFLLILASSLLSRALGGARRVSPLIGHCALFATGCAVLCVVWFLPNTLHPGAALWIIAHTLLTYAIWTKASYRSSRGFEVLPSGNARESLPIVGRRDEKQIQSGGTEPAG